LKHLPSFSPDPLREPQKEPEISDVLREAVGLLRSNLVPMLILGTVLAALGFVLAQRAEKLYNSRTQIMIDRAATSPIQAEEGKANAVDPSYTDGQVLLIVSDALLLKVIDKAKLLDEPYYQPDPPSLLRRAIDAAKALLPSQGASLNIDPEQRRRTSALNALSDSISVTREGETNVVTIDAHANSPLLAQRVAQTLAQTYIDYRLSQREQNARQLSNWVDARAQELRHKLSEAEDAATAYKVANNLISDARGARLSEQQLTDLNAELIKSRADLAEKSAAYEQARKVLDGQGDPDGLPSVQSSPIIQMLRETQLDLERRAQDAATIGGKNNPRLDQIQRQIDAVRQQRSDEIKRIAEGLANETQALESRTQLLGEALDRAGGKTGEETVAAVRLRELERVADAYRTRYEHYLNNAGLATELSTFDTSGTEIVSAASLPLEPYYPPTKVFMILGFLGGMMIALSAALLRKTLRREFNSLRDVEDELGLNVLSVLPLLGPREKGPDMVRRAPFSEFSEAISVLSLSLMARAKELMGRDAPIVLITSAEDNVGKTTIVASLGEAATTTGKRVLLIDGDLRFAGLSAINDMENDVGLCEILTGAMWLNDGDDTAGVLDILPAGKLQGRQPASYLESPKLREFLSLARTQYDLIVIDGPPVANFADCRILAREASMVAVVLRAGRTSPETTRAALRQLPRAKVAGVIVTGVEPTAMAAGRWSLGGAYRPANLRPTKAQVRRPAQPALPKPHSEVV